MNRTRPSIALPGTMLFAAGLALFHSASFCQGGEAGTAAPREAPAKQDARYRVVSFHSDAVAKARLGETGDIKVHVLLPPSYAASSRRYPVVYLLHGFGDPPQDLLETVRGPLGEAVAAGTSPEYLLIAVDGCNRLGGSFYVNSEATGHWEDMVAKELPAFIEKAFRVIPEAQARALAGYSMGGFGAWNLALAHADRFQAAWAACPGAFDGRGLEDAMPTWDAQIRTAYGAAFSPAPEPPFISGTPRFDGSPSDRAIAARWWGGFGHIEGKLARYQAHSARLKAIRFDYGAKDGYKWIPRGTVHIAGAMKAAGLPVEIAAWDAGHVVNGEMVRKGFIPFFAKVFPAGMK